MTTKEYECDSELLYLISENNEEASDTIFKKYAPVMDYYAKKYASYVEGKGIDYNDLYQEGQIGLNSAINNYKQQKDIKFSTFAFICIKRRILTAVKNVNRKKHSILNESYSLDYRISEDDNNCFENIIHASEESIEDLLVNQENEAIFKQKIEEKLSDFEKMVYELRINGFTYDEIAETIGKTHKSVECALARIRLKIKEILNEIN